MKGKFAIDRELFTHPIWLREIFTRGQAWVDLLGLANFEEGYIRVRGNRIQLNRGDVGWSVVRLAKRWKWSRGKVERFINELKMDQMIDVKTNNRISTVISIKNYDLYQFKKQQNEHKSVQQTDNKRVTKNNVNNENNVNKPQHSHFLGNEGKQEDYEKFLIDRKREIEEERLRKERYARG